MTQEVLAGRYELLELIGGGGMADVYKAHDILLDRPVAVKLLHEQFSNDAEFVNKFTIEARHSAGINHPNIVNIFDVGQDAGRHFIVMEYVAGETLKARIQREGHLSVAESLSIAKEIASALVQAHRMNIIHCDIKPHNILITREGHVKVADFGIARAVSAATMTYGNNVVGSVHYFSPEQAKGTTLTPKTDVYSLGVVMYEMLTGQLPFNGETPVAIALKHLQDTAPSVRQLDSSIPPVVEAIVSKAMTKDPDARPESSQLVRDISQAQAMIKNNTPGSEDPFVTQIIPRVTAKQIQNGKADPEYDDDEYESPRETSMWKSKKFIAALIGILVMGFFVGSFLSYGKFWSTAEVVVPNVTGKQMAVAKQILEDNKLRVNIAETYDSSVPVGQVVSQDPEGGSKVKEERLVTIYISKGGEEIEMPELKGMTKSSAEDRLKKLGLKLGTVAEVNSSEPEGTVLSTQPKAGSKVSKGETVDMTVSKGEKKNKLSLPSYVGSSLNTAKSNLSANKLRVGNITQEPSEKPEGTVLSQSPVAGSDVTEGTAIDLVVAGPSAVSKSQPASEPKTEPAESPTPGNTGASKSK